MRVAVLFGMVAFICVQFVAANPKADWNNSKFSQAAPQLLQEYIRVDTRNPPGNESRGVEFFAAIFKAAGIEFESGESAPGRGNIWARIRGGDKPGLVLLHHMDVVPPEAILELDCRLLPDQDPSEFLEELTTLINDPNIEIESIMSFTPAISSTNTLLFESLQSVLTRFFEGAKVVPAVSTGFTDSHFFRDMDIVSYGFSPFLLDEADARTVHGNNERVSIENVRRGTAVMIDVVDALIRD